MQENLFQTVEVEIVDDNVSGEPDQLFELELQSVPVDVQVARGVTTIVIDDDDRE